MDSTITRPAANPMGAMARRLHLNRPPKLSLPGKLVFPSNHNSGHFSMLGLGDIVMPGLLLCFVMRYDAYKRAQVSYFLIQKNLKKLLNQQNLYDIVIFWLGHKASLEIQGIYFSSCKSEDYQRIDKDFVKFFAWNLGSNSF